MVPLLTLLALIAPAQSHLRHQNGFLAREPVVKVLQADEVAPAEAKATQPRRAPAKTSERSPEDPLAEIIEPPPKEKASGQGMDIRIEKVRTNMVLPSAYKVSAVTTTESPRGDCVCKLGMFLHWKTKECVPQKPWGYECDLYTEDQQQQVCEDGLVCKSLNVSDTYVASGDSKGWTSTSPANCEYCTPGDKCEVGKARHDKVCVRSGDLTKVEELDSWDDERVFEAWGKKERAGADEVGLRPFGGQQPEMCVTVKVTVPALTLSDKSTRVIEAKINTTLEVLANATEKAEAQASATAKTRRQAAVEVQAEASATQKATATAEATYTAYAEARDTATASYKAVATANAQQKVKEDGSKAKIVIEATAAAREKGEASSKEIANSTRTVTAKGEGDVTLKLKQKGRGQATAEAEKNVTVRMEGSDSVQKSKILNVKGIGTFNREFQATATAKAIVEAKACVAADQAVERLGLDAKKLSGIPYARSVYKEAEREAYSQAREKATRAAVDLATKEATKRIDEDIDRQADEYKKAHKAELQAVALQDALKGTLPEQRELQASASQEALANAAAKVKAAVPIEAKKTAEAEAQKAAEAEAKKIATSEAQKQAQEGLEAKAMAKAKAEAEEKAEANAKANAFKLAKSVAEEDAKAKAVQAAKASAKDAAEEKAKAAAQAAAQKQAEDKAARIASAGAAQMSQEAEEKKSKA